MMLNGICSTFKEKESNCVRIIIIDSGVDDNHKLQQEKEIFGATAYVNKANEPEFSDDFSDVFGHGTAIWGIIDKNTSNSIIYNIKMFDSEGNADQPTVVKVLEYIYHNIYCEIINLSLGFTQYEDTNEFEEIINKLHSKGIIIVSAFSNDGAMSFPAAFKNVIGVESNRELRKKDEFEYVESSAINIRAKVVANVYCGNILMSTLWLRAIVFLLHLLHL